ncbi:MAG: ABC transporter ATP-binding protein [Gemmatimonadetes bacterium]|nr:MAG: ABC transporter ATP-binding protein [Gemmatimonadota bacterium]
MSSYEAFQEEDYSKRFDLALWKKVLRFTLPHKKYMILLAVFMVSLAALDASLPLLTMYAIDHFIAKNTLEGLPLFVLIYLVIIIGFSLVVFCFISIAGRIETYVCYDIRTAGFKRLQELSFSYFDRKPVGWLMARMTSDIQRLSDTIAWGVVDFVWGTTMMAGIALVMLYLNWKIGLIVLTVVPMLAIVSLYFQKMILKSYRNVRKLNSRITASFNEGIMGAKTTKTLVREAENLQEFKELTGGMYRSSVLAAVQSSLYLPFVLVIGAIGSGLAIWFGGSGVIAGTLTYGTLVAFISYAQQFFNPVQELARIFAELQNAQASAERVMSMIETEPEIKDDPQVLQQYERVHHPPQNGKQRGVSTTRVMSQQDRSVPRMRGQIEFCHVDFAYKEGQHVLSDFNLTVRPGETIALVGETGAGKSTIVNLACRFYEPTGGIIKIDGTDYTRLPLHWIHSNLGVVLQSPHLFSGTILENIRYGRLDATDEQVVEAAKLVHAHHFITTFENGYHTEVGEGGSLLSTGQKQLISFARAILADPALFILDEATSSVDTETEQLIQKAIDRVLENRTSFIIAHRLSTIRAADRILVLEYGKIIEQGNHHDLLLKKGHYYNLYTQQFVHEHEEVMLGACQA